MSRVIDGEEEVAQVIEDSRPDSATIIRPTKAIRIRGRYISSPDEMK